MKTIYSKKILSFVSVFVLFTFSFANAQSIKTSELAFSFSFFNNFFDNSSEKAGEDIFTQVLGNKEIESEIEVKSEDVSVAKDILKNSCEYYDTTADNLLALETASANAKEKIDNVEETISREESVRDSIFYSVKNLIGLQKTDKVIFREMRKDLDDAKDYYQNLDEKITDTNNFLDSNNCEKVKLPEAKKVDNDTSDLVQDEITFRKQFAASLKEKLKILQDGVKEAKK